MHLPIAFRMLKVEKPDQTYAVGAASAGAAADFFPYFLLNRSTRPAESTSFCFPVKKGWHAEQISTCRLPTVERVSKVLPQTQVTIDFL